MGSLLKLNRIIFIAILLLLLSPGQISAPEHTEVQTVTGSAHVMRSAQEISRGEEPMRVERVVMECTGYTNKDPGMNGLGITANGNKTQEWYTIAADPSIPFGTEIYIPYFADKPNRGIFVVEDRGGSITTGKLDIYFGDPAVDDTALSRALEFGRRELEVFIRR